MNMAEAITQIQVDLADRYWFIRFGKTITYETGYD